jgi:hypothetical protein
MGLEILKRAQNMTVAQGRRKHLEFGGAPASRGTVLLKRAPKNFFPEMLSTGGGGVRKFFLREIFRHIIPKLLFVT